MTLSRLWSVRDLRLCVYVPGKVQAGESVLIHGGASGVGTAATQLCVQAGARPLITAGSAAKLDTARSLGAVGAFNYKEDDVTAGVMKATEGEPVWVIAFVSVWGR